MKDIKLEAGKFYETRDGRKMYCIGLSHVLQYRPWVMESPDAAQTNYTELGTIFPDQESEMDIIGEWKEPLKGRVYLNVYMAGNPPHPTFRVCTEPGLFGKYDTDLAYIGVDWEEGMFDNDE